MSDSLRPHKLQHTRLPWPSISLWVCSDSCPLSQWCHLTILSSVTLFSSCPPSCSALVPFSHSVMSDSLRPHEPQHTRPPVHHQLLKFTQTPVHWVGDAIQPSYPLSSPSPPALNLSQHQGLFQWVSSSHHVAKVLEFQLQHQAFQWIFRVDFL